jgi:hypothetical protein
MYLQSNPSRWKVHLKPALWWQSGLKWKMAWRTDVDNGYYYVQCVPAIDLSSKFNGYQQGIIEDRNVLRQVCYFRMKAQVLGKPWLSLFFIIGGMQKFLQSVFGLPKPTPTIYKISGSKSGTRICWKTSTKGPRDYSSFCMMYWNLLRFRLNY